MSSSRYFFYECENPECRLRFPGLEGQPRWNSCPACRSSVHIVAPVDHTAVSSREAETPTDWIVEALLDNIRSAWNVGSIFRTCDGTGVKKLYLGGITPTPNNPRVGRTALGAEETIPWEKHPNGVVLSKHLKTNGYSLWALEDTPQAIPLFELPTEPIKSPILLVVGNEVCGVDPGILQLCDKVISIRMVGKKESYNVAVAFGIAASFLLYRHSVSQGSFKIFPKT